MKYEFDIPKKIAGVDYSGLFITFEGPEGSGKTTQSYRLHHILDQEFDNLAPWTKEPGGPLDESRLPLYKLQGDLRVLWLTSKDKRSDIADLEFMCTQRALHLDYLMGNLTQGQIVICERFADSTRAYQGGGGQLDMNMINAANAIATQGLEPDITILVDVPYEVGMRRKIGDELDHFETKDKEFHIRVGEMYRQIARENPERFIVVNGEPKPEMVTQEIMEKLISHPAYQAYLER